MKLYLVTGFLGAGKTAFMKQFIPLFRGKKLAVIINEFGKEGIDGKLLASLAAEEYEITNGSIFCACRMDQFSITLTDCLKSGAEVAVVEASGLSDPTGVYAMMQKPEFSQVEYMGCICLVDAMRFAKVLTTARVVKKQLGVSDLVLVNKTDLASAAELDAVSALVHSLKPGVEILYTSYGQVTEAEQGKLLKPDRRDPLADDGIIDITLQKFMLSVDPMFTPEQLRSCVRILAEDSYRVKGFALLGAGTFLVDCAGGLISVTPYTGEITAPNELVVLSAASIPTRKAFEDARELYPNITMR